MLIEFSVGNFRSFKDPVTLSLVASKRNAKDKSIDENNTIKVDENLKLLTSAAIYGANASGKSNLVAAVSFMRRLILNSSKESQASETIKVNNFRLSTSMIDKPSFFEMVFIVDKEQYRYGFEVTKDAIQSEWLFKSGKARESKLFTRERSEYHINNRSFKEGKGLVEKTRTNALYLSVVAQFNGAISTRVIQWFRNLGVVSGLEEQGYMGFTLRNFAKENLGIVQFVKAMDVGIENIKHKLLDETQLSLPDELPEDVKNFILKSPGPWLRIETIHKLLDDKGVVKDTVAFDLNNDESHGTQKLFFLAGPILDALEKGRVLFIDELEARLHPLITCEIIGRFNSKQTNQKSAQLVFTTHDTNLLSNKRFRRDQIWFTEKNPQGATDLYSLVEFKIRNDASFESDYIQGKYGAIPYINNIEPIALNEE